MYISIEIKCAPGLKTISDSKNQFIAVVYYYYFCAERVAIYTRARVFFLLL